MNLSRVKGRVLAVLALLALPLTAQAQQGTGNVVGRVIDGATSQPVDGAQVVVVGTNRGALANAEGRFLITGVPAGEQTIRVVSLGYAQASSTITVQPGQSATVDFTLQTTALPIDELIVTATGQKTLKREIGSKVGVIDAANVEMTPIRSVSDLLQGREAGVTVLGSGGTAGAGARIRIRGSNSISLSNSPLLIVDGVRVDDTSNSYGLFTGGFQPSRLDDFNPQDVESIEILKGPSAAALYGTAAANGVIQVTTKRGRAGNAEWKAWVQGSQIDRNITMPDNVFSVDANGSRCDLIDQASNSCNPSEILRYNPLENSASTPFRTGNGQKYGVSVSGGSEATTYYLSGELEKQVGVQEENRLQRVNLRANVSGQAGENVRFSAQAGYVNYDGQFPQNDNSGLGVLYNGLTGVPTQAVIDQQQGYALPRDYLFAWDNFQNLQRTTLSTNLDWQPLSWLSVNATGGLDDVDQHDNDILAPNVLTLFGPPFSIGFRESQRANVVNYTATGSATAQYSPTQGLETTTSVGTQYYEDRTESVYATGAGLTPGTGSLGATTSQFAVGESNIQNRTLGAFASTQLAWQNRIFLNAAVRGDKNSAFGTNLGWIWYPSFSGSWVVSDESFFPQMDWLSGLRLRAAWGESGLRPSFRQAKQYFAGTTAVGRDENEEPGFVISGAGNPDLKPQRSTEWELGFEAGMISDRVGLDLTYYRKESENDIINRPLAPSAGASGTRAENLGLMVNKGVEVGLNADLIRGPGFTWSVRATGALTDNNLESLGDQPPIVFGLLGSTQRHVEGFPAGGYWQPPIESYSDANGDGLIGADEVTVGDTAVFLGKVFPDKELTLSTDVELSSWLRVGGLLDYRGGHSQFNATEWGRCNGPSAVCRARHDPTASLKDQAAAVAADVYGTVAGYIEPADFWKLREITATVRLPQEWFRTMPGSDVTLTLAGRNLFTWTDYTGFDPEVNGSAQSNFSTQDNTTLPPFRTFMIRMDISF